MRDVIRRNWRFWVVLAEVLILTVLFARYLKHRQDVTDHRAEIQRAAICAILANIPGHVPAEISRARVVFARPGQPGDCQPVRGGVTPKPTPIQVFINGKPAEIIVAPPTGRTPTPTATRTVRPSPRPTPTRRPTPTPTRTRTPSPSPSPSRSCLLILCR